MALIGNGLQNGSPFYTGYEYTPNEAPDMPTGLITLAKLLPTMPTAAAGKKAAADKTTTDKTFVTGTTKTGLKLKSDFDNVEAGLQSTKAKMEELLRNDSSPNKEKAIAAISTSGLDKQLKDLIAAREGLKTQIPVANRDLGAIKAVDEGYNSNPDLKNEAFVTEINGVIVLGGSNDKGSFITYGDKITEGLAADNTVVDPNTGLTTGIKNNNYSELTNGISQRGALQKRIDDVYAITSGKNVGSAGERLIDPNSVSNLAGFIKGTDWTSNWASAAAAANDLKYNKLTLAEQNDLAAQTAQYVKDGGNIGGVLTADEIAAVQKNNAIKNGDYSTLTQNDLDLIDSAQDKYLVSKIDREKTKYLTSDYKENLDRAPEGEGKDKVDYALTKLTDQVHTVKLDGTIFKGMKLYTEAEAKELRKKNPEGFYPTVQDAENYTIQFKAPAEYPLKVPVTVTTDLKQKFNPKTGEWDKMKALKPTTEWVEPKTDDNPNNWESLGMAGQQKVDITSVWKVKIGGKTVYAASGTTETGEKVNVPYEGDVKAAVETSKYGKHNKDLPFSEAKGEQDKVDVNKPYQTQGTSNYVETKSLNGKNYGKTSNGDWYEIK